MELTILWIGILQIGLLILCGYVGGRVTRRFNLGEVSGQILGGLVAGPAFLEGIVATAAGDQWLGTRRGFAEAIGFAEGVVLEYGELLSHAQVFVFLFVGIVVFSHGREIQWRRLRDLGIGPILICLIQAGLTFGAVTLLFRFVFGLGLPESLLIGSIGVSTTPALIFAVMNRLHIEGRLETLTANLIVLNDLIEVTLFSFFLAYAELSHATGSAGETAPGNKVLGTLAIAVVIGVILFLCLKVAIRARRPGVGETKHEHARGEAKAEVAGRTPTPAVEVLLVVTGLIAVAMAFAVWLHVPVLITVVIAGILVANFHHADVFESLREPRIMTVFNLVFFALIGASIDLSLFGTELVTPIFVVGYILVRGAAKVGGTWLGAVLTGQDEKARACLPPLLLGQGELVAAETVLLTGAFAGSEGIVNTVIPALVVFSLGGAYWGERALVRWKAWVVGEGAVLAGTHAVEDEAQIPLGRLLGNRIRRIAATTPTEAVEMLSSHLADLGLLDDVELACDAVFERETLAGTAVGHGVAIPHCRLGVVDQTVAICGVLEEPIRWTGTAPRLGRSITLARRRELLADDDEAPLVDVIILLVSPQSDDDGHLLALATIARAFRDDELLDRFRTAVRDGETSELLAEIERPR